MTHPCFVCDDVGSFPYQGCRIACDCRSGQRLSPMHQRSATHDAYASDAHSTVVSSEADSTPKASPAIEASHSGPTVTVTSHFIPEPFVGGA